MNRRLQTLTATALVLMALAAGLLLRMKHSHRLGAPGVKVVKVPLLSDTGDVARTNSVFLPSIVPGWASRTEPVSTLELNYLPKDTTYGRRIYRTSDGQFSAFGSVVLMGTDRTSIHRPEYCLTGIGWGIEKRAYATVRMNRPHGYDLPVRRFDAARNQVQGGQPQMRKGVYVFWFVSEHELTANHWTRQWLIARDLLLRGTLNRWAYVSFFAECDPGQEDATFARLSELIAATVPEFQFTSGAAVN